MKIKLAVQIFSFFLVCDLSTGLKCFHCQLKDGEGDEDCDRIPPPEDYLRECGAPQCWMRYSNDGTIQIERFCAAVSTNINGCMAVMSTDSDGKTRSGVECNCSNHNGCNGFFPNTNGAGAIRSGRVHSNHHYHRHQYYY